MTMERILPGLFDAVPDALIVVDGDGRIVMANRQAEHLFGYAEQGLIGAEIEILLPEEAHHRHRSHRAGYMAKPHIRPMGASGQTLVGLRKDGTQFPVEIALSPVEGDTGPRYLASIRDVSETQRARQALVRAGYDALVARIGQLALESNDEASVLAQVPELLAEALSIDAVGIALLSSDRKSAEIRAIAGFPDPIERVDPSRLAEVLDRAAPIVVADLSDDSAGFPLRQTSTGSGALMPLIDRNRAVGALIAYSRQNHRFDHDALHLLQSVANLLAALGQRRHTEEQLAHAQRLDALGQLTGGIAHDFNNLLTVMSGSLQLLELETQQQPESQELIATALRSVSRGAELTSKLLAFARRQRLLPQSTDLAVLLQDVGFMLKRTLGDSIRLQVDCQEGVPAAFVDPTQLDAALVNLVLNARDAMPNGGDIRISARQVLVDATSSSSDLPIGYYILITVADTGRGMSPDTLARAMEPFFTTKDAGRGSGLGLSMVYGFAKQSGGHLEINSASGHGTRVELFLPVSRRAAESPAPASATRTVGGGETVLVVEDDPSVRSIAVAFLRSSGYRVLAAASAEEAHEILKDEPQIAVLFSDVMLGNGKNGKLLAREASVLKPELAILLTSGYEEQFSIGADDFDLLRKPYRREQLLAAIHRLLAPHQSAGT